eukprot:5888538-Prymnesium_polylepis.1
MAKYVALVLLASCQCARTQFDFGTAWSQFQDTVASTAAVVQAKADEVDWAKIQKDAQESLDAAKKMAEAATDATLEATDWVKAR